MLGTEELLIENSPSPVRLGPSPGAQAEEAWRERLPALVSAGLLTLVLAFILFLYLRKRKGGARRRKLSRFADWGTSVDDSDIETSYSVSPSSQSRSRSRSISYGSTSSASSSHRMGHHFIEV